ncbi:MAG: tetratricopeptide repeat protein [Pseudolabrys sp.]
MAAFCLAFAALAFSPQASATEPVKGEVSVSTEGGYARFIFRFDDEVTAQVRMSGAIMVIKFDRPVDVPVERLSQRAPAYISAARRDPDGMAIRFALMQRIKYHVMPVAERTYLDLLPANWTGILPGLPQEVIDELANRARDAEKKLREQRGDTARREPPMIRVKVGSQPTFTRYVFNLPDKVAVTPSRAGEKMTLKFDMAIKWDLADATVALPSTLASVETKRDYTSAAVTFTLKGKPDVRTFREEQNFIVDIGTGAAAGVPTMKLGGADASAEAAKAPAIEPPQTVPAKGAAPAPQVNASLPAPNSAPPAPAKAPAPEPAPPKAAAAAPTPAPAPLPPLPELAPPLPGPEKAAAAAPPKPSEAPATEGPKTKPDAQHTAAPKAAETPKAKVDAAAPAKLKTAAAAPSRPHLPVDPKAPVVAEVQRSGDNVQISFPFAVPTPAAAFRRADVLWLVFDSTAKLDLAALNSDTSTIIRSVTQERGKDGEAIIRIKLVRPRLAGISPDGPGWNLNIGDTVIERTKPLGIARNIVGRNRASITIPFEEPGQVHRIVDPDMGDTLMVVTALGPARGFLKPQEFIELRALASAHGVVVQPIADDLTAELSVDKIILSRPGGLTISAIELNGRVSGMFRALTFDTQLWGYNRQAEFSPRQSELIGMAASAPKTRRNLARYNLARFYLARGLSAEARAVADVTLKDQKSGGDEVTGTVLKAVADVLLARPVDALKSLANPQIGNQHDAPIWRAIAYAQQGKWDEARDGFKNVEASIAALPIELQRLALMMAARASVELNDFSGAAKLLDEIATIGVTPELEPSVAVLTGRLDQGLGRNEEALAAYHSAANSKDRRAGAQGRLREIELRFSSGEMSREDAIGQLETLTTVWRGDETEVEGLKLLAHLYTEEQRYRDAFHVMRTAMLAHPNSDLTRKIQDEAATTFDSLFLDGKGDAMPAVEALGLFYDYRELTPIGRRGDEMIRKLADRLVSVDLLDQAAELLQHQIDHRLQGAARAQVATRLAVIYLLNHKPDRAIKTLQTTRSGELSNELRDQRLLLEARALSEVGRHSLALEVIANLTSHEAIRLRSDILWAARRWREAAEQIELLYGDRWKSFTPLTETERNDILRAAIGYALGEEPIGLDRFREKYAAKMAEGPDRRAFDVVSAPIGTSGDEFRAVARKIAGLDTLNAFLTDMRKRYPDASALSPGAPPLPKPGTPQASANPAPGKLGEPPKTVAPAKPAANAAKKPADAPPPPKVPEGVPLKPDPAPTGSIPRVPLPRPKPRMFAHR